MSEQKTDTTTVSTVDLDIDDILGTPGAENIMIPSADSKTDVPKNTVFSSKPVDMTFLEKDDKNPPENPKASPSPEDIHKELDELQDVTSEKTQGRPKTDKDAMVEITKKMIEAGKLIPFDDDKPIEKYTVQDFEELLEANIQERERKLREEVPMEFFDSLPEELQYAAKYVADGGQDLKGLFRTLAQVEEVRSLDPTREGDQEQIVRAYLHATQFGTSEEIEEEILAWKDRDELESKANKFKPKLDAMQQQVVARKLETQEKMRKQQEAQAQHYMENVYKTLNPGELNGIKLDKKTQSMLYAGLVQPNYPSISGRPTNLLGHLLEKYQFVEPRHDLIAEALWLLSDPEGYRSKVKEGGKMEATEKSVRMLKTEQANKNASYTPDEDDRNDKPASRPKLQRGSNNFFKR